MNPGGDVTWCILQCVTFPTTTAGDNNEDDSANVSNTTRTSSTRTGEQPQNALIMTGTRELPDDKDDINTAPL